MTNAKKAKALRRKMREVFGDEVHKTGRSYDGSTGQLRNEALTGRRLYQDAKRQLKDSRD